MGRTYRTSIASRRLAGYDYAGGGAYFLTLCVEGRRRRFGRLVGGRVELTAEGRIVAEEWRRVAKVRPGVILDAFVVMPDHFHAIVILPPRGRAETGGAASPGLGRPPRSLGSLVAMFKATSTRRIRGGVPGPRIWQRNYYDRIIRNAAAMAAIRAYIRANPARG